MAIDSIDIRREEIKRDEKKKSERTELERRQQQGKDFMARYQKQIQTAEKIKTQSKETDQQDEKSHDLLQRVVEAYKEKTSDQQKGEQQDAKNEFLKKEELKREDLKKEEEKPSHSTKKESKSVSEEGHRRVGSTDSSQQDGGGGGGGGGQGFSDGRSGGGGSGGDFGGSSGFSHDRSQSKFDKAAGKLSGTSSFSIKGISGMKGSGSGLPNQLKKETLDEISIAVAALINSEGQKEMEIELKDEVLSGLKFRATQTDNGVIIKFSAPTRAMKDLLAQERSKMMIHFKSKGIRIVRIEVS